MRFPQRAAYCAELESDRREVLDRPVMKQGCQMTSLPRSKPAHDVEEHARRSSSGAGILASRDPMGVTLPVFITHDHLRGSDRPTQFGR
jgi:hypothetical protein